MSDDLSADYSNDPDDAQETNQRDVDNMIKLLIYFFKQFVQEKEIDESAWHEVAAYSLFTWLSEKRNSLDRAVVMEAVDIPYNDEIYDLFLSMINSRASASQVEQLWPYVVFHNRGLPTVPLEHMIVSVQLLFADGSMLPIPSMVSARHMVGVQLSEQTICSFFTKMASEIREILYKHTLDSLRETKALNSGGARGHEALLKAVAAEVRKAPEPTRSFLSSWAKILCCMSPFGLPPEILQKLDGMTADARDEEKKEESQSPEQTPPPQSGWNHD